jgi:hypothetical protein
MRRSSMASDERLVALDRRLRLDAGRCGISVSWESWAPARRWGNCVPDWLDFIKSIPGLAKAITDLIGDISHLGSSAAKLGSAKIDRPRRAIEDQTNRDTAATKAMTESEVAITRALSDATVDYIKANAIEIGERALSNGVHRLIKQQRNRELVVIETIENLQLDPPKSVPSDPPSDDWLNLFGRYAENASSDKMRQHWAHLLEGEIRRPGSFSFITLHLASVLDERLAKTIEQFRPWIFEERNIPLINPISEGERYSELITLAAIGFLDMGNHAIHIDESQDCTDIRIKFDAGTLVVPPGPPAVQIGNVSLPKLRVTIPTAIITPAGLELLSVLPKIQQNADLPRFIFAFLQREGFVGITFTANG